MIMPEKYNILHKKELLYSDLTEDEYFDILENLSTQFYQTGSPRPEDLKTTIIRD